MQPLKAIFYDLDGTLVHFLIDYRKARKSAINELEKHGISKAKEIFSVEVPWTTTIEKAKKILKEELGFSNDKIAGIQNKVNAKIVAIEREAALRAKKVDNIEHLLEFGKNLNIRQIIVTFNTHDVAVLTLKTVGLLSYFDAVYGRDDVCNPKPNGEHLQIAANKYGFKPESSIVIGDMKSDILVAHNFGCKAIGIRTDFEINYIDDADFIVEQKDAAERIIEILRSKFVIN
jgi:phosphoglycolate phosphatase